jgi:hypothetical protein
VDLPIEVKFAGVTVGRATLVKDWTEAGAFVGFAEPLPTGTRIELRGDGAQRTARVAEVFESADPAVAGMRLTFTAAAADPVPAAAPIPAVAAPIPAAVVSEPAPAAVSEAVSAAAPDPAPAAHDDAPAGGETGDGAPGGGKRRRRRR